MGATKGKRDGQSAHTYECYRREGEEGKTRGGGEGNEMEQCNRNAESENKSKSMARSVVERWCDLQREV